MTCSEGSNDAVSPVVGVIIVVAITVLLSAAIATLVLDMGESTTDAANGNLGTSVAYNATHATIQVVTGTADRITVKVDGTEVNSLDNPGIGDTLTVEATTDSILTVIGENDGSKTVVATHKKPNRGGGNDDGSSTIPATVSQQWVDTYDNGGRDQGYGIDVDSNGNVLVAGESYNDTNADYYTAKFDADGNKLWDVHWDSGNGGDGASDLVVDSSDNAYVTGSVPGSPSSIHTKKYDTDGNQVWSDTYTLTNDTYGMNMDIGPNGNIYVAGYTSNSNYEAVVVKYAPDGTRLDSFTYTGGFTSFLTRDISVDDSGNIILVGENSLWVDLVTVKLDSTGVEQWSQVKDVNGGDDIAHGVTTDADGNVFVGGEAETGSGTYAFESVAVKYDGNGNQVWATTHNVSGESAPWDEARDIALDPEGGVYLTGTGDSSYDVITVKLDANGDHAWNHTWGPSTSTDYGYALAVDDDGSVYVTGDDEYDDLITIKYAK